MIKACKVVSVNNKVAVVLYDNIKIQVPSHSVYDDIAYINFNDGKYYVTTKAEFENSSIKKKQHKKTVVETKQGENENDIGIDNEGMGYNHL